MKNGLLKAQWRETDGDPESGGILPQRGAIAGVHLRGGGGMLLLLLCLGFFLAIKHPILDPNARVAGNGSNLFVCSGPLEVVIDRHSTHSRFAPEPCALHLELCASSQLLDSPGIKEFTEDHVT